MRPSLSGSRTSRSATDVEMQTLYWIQKYSQVSPAAGRPMKAFKRAACTDSASSLSLSLSPRPENELY